MLKDLTRVGKHSIIYGLGGVVQKLVGFLMVPVYTRYLSPTDYGVAALIMFTVTLAGMLWNNALNRTISRFYFDYKRQKERNAVISTSLVIQTIFSVIVSAGVIMFSSKISYLLFDTSRYALFINLAFIAFLLQSIIEIPMTLLRLVEKSVFYSVISVVRLFVALFLNILLIVFLDMGLLGIFVSGVVTSGLVFFLLVPKTIFETGIKFSMKKARHMMKFALPLVPGGLLIFVLMRADVFLLQKLSTTAQVGLYNLGIQLGTVLIYLIEQPFFLIWYPFVYSSLKKPKINKVFSRMQTYFFFILIFFSLCLAVLIKPVLSFLVGPDFFEVYKVVPLIVLAFFFRPLSDFFKTGLQIKKKTKMIPLILGVGVIINLALNFILIPGMGYMGAAVAKLSAFAVIALVAYFISIKIYKITPEKRVIFALIVAIVYYFVSLLISVESIVLQITLDVLFLMTFPLVLYLLRVFRKDEIKKTKEILKKIKNVRSSKIK